MHAAASFVFAGRAIGSFAERLVAWAPCSLLILPA
jgi:hypothetical protein